MSQTFGPYSPIRQSGNMFFISGQVGVDPETKQAGKTVEEQTSQALSNLAAVLASADLEMDNVVKTTVYLTHMDNYAAMNDVYTGYFNLPRPARAAVGVKELPRVGGDTPILVEIEAVAIKEST